METTQRLQNPIIKEYTLNHIRDPIIIKVYSLIKGFWSLCEPRQDLGFRVAGFEGISFRVGGLGFRV